MLEQSSARSSNDTAFNPEVRHLEIMKDFLDINSEECSSAVITRTACVSFQNSSDQSYVQEQAFDLSNYPAPILCDYETSASCSDFTDDESFTESDEDDSISPNVDNLLKFSQKITKDLRQLFRRNEGQPDFCEIYEHKSTTTKSGRDMYYADILAMAQYGDKADSSAVKLGESSSDIPLSLSPTPKTKWACTGYANSSLGLGPLKELFTRTTINPDQLIMVHPSEMTSRKHDHNLPILDENEFQIPLHQHPWDQASVTDGNASYCKSGNVNHCDYGNVMTDANYFSEVLANSYIDQYNQETNGFCLMFDERLQ